MGRTISYRCSYPVLALLFIIVATAEAQHHKFHFHVTQQRRPNHNRPFYTQHTVFANPLLYHQHQTSPSPSKFFHPSDFYHHFNGLIGGDYGRVPFDGPLFIPADGLETAETSRQVENYNKALLEILEEQLGATGGANDSNRGSSSDAGDQLNFNTDVLGGRTSFVSVRQSFSDKNSNYNYQYAL